MTAPASILAFAGRRIDAPDTAPARFPVQNVARVERALAQLFDARAPAVIVGSGACGADILILEAARARGVRTHLVLPFAAARFRETSVVDRGAEWGPRFDQALAYAERNGRVLMIPAADGGNDEAYARATEAIFAEAEQLAHALNATCAALAVWDQSPRGSADATLQFLDLARQQQLECVEISTV